MNHDYKKLARYPVLAVGLSMVSFIMIKTGRDAVFFVDWGIQRLPLAYVWIAIAAVPAAMIHLRAMSKWGARKVRAALFVITAFSYFLFVPYVAPENTVMMTIMFISTPVIFAGVFAGAWLLAGDLLEGAEASFLRIIYSKIGAGAMIGGIMGGLLSKIIAAYAGPRWLIAAGSFILLLTGWLLAKAHRAAPETRYENLEKQELQPDAHESFAQDQSVLLRQKYVQLLIGISVLATLAALFIDFQFYAMATVSGNNNAQFFANFYIVLNLISLAIQIFVSPRLQKKLGVTGALFLLPMALLGGAGLFSFWTFVQARTILRVLEGGLKASIHRSMWEQVYLPIQRRFRDAAKTVVDGVVQRLAEGLGALTILVWFWLTETPVKKLNFDWISWAIVGSLLLWILLTRKLAKFGCADLDPSESLIRLPDG